MKEDRCLSACGRSRHQIDVTIPRTRPAGNWHTPWTSHPARFGNEAGETQMAKAVSESCLWPGGEKLFQSYQAVDLTIFVGPLDRARKSLPTRPRRLSSAVWLPWGVRSFDGPNSSSSSLCCLCLCPHTAGRGWSSRRKMMAGFQCHPHLPISPDSVWMGLRTKGSSCKIMLRPPIAAVYPPQGKLHGNRSQGR